MSVELDPVELGFRRPFTREVAEVLRLKNPHSEPLAFKVKTTAPKQYCVRPNSGRIEAGQQVEVQVLLQAMKEDPPADAKCRDKFLVQTVAVSADQESSNVAAIWSNIEATAKSSIQEKKIRVSFLAADGGAAAAATPARKASNLDDSTAFSSPGPASTPQQNSTSTPTFAGTKQPETNGTSATKDTPSTNGEQSMLGAAVASIASVIPTSGEDVKAQLADAQAQISRLTQQIQDQGLRQRKVDTSSQATSSKSSTATTSQQVSPSGVPVPLVAALCLLSFIIAYLLF